MSSTVIVGAGSYQVCSEARGAHWVAWVEDADGKPRRAAVLIGETQEIVEQRACRLAQRLPADEA